MREKEQITTTHTHTQSNNMNLIVGKAPPEQYQQPNSYNLYRWDGNKREK